MLVRTPTTLAATSIVRVRGVESVAADGKVQLVRFESFVLLARLSWRWSDALFGSLRSLVRARARPIDGDNIDDNVDDINSSFDVVVDVCASDRCNASDDIVSALARRRRRRQFDSRRRIVGRVAHELRDVLLRLVVALDNDWFGPTKGDEDDDARHAASFVWRVKTRNQKEHRHLITTQR